MNKACTFVEVQIFGTCGATNFTLKTGEMLS